MNSIINAANQWRENDTRREDLIDDVKEAVAIEQEASLFDEEAE